MYRCIPHESDDSLNDFYFYTSSVCVRLLRGLNRALQVAFTVDVVLPARQLSGSWTNAVEPRTYLVLFVHLPFPLVVTLLY